jgi:multidrug resistance efflux pump
MHSRQYDENVVRHEDDDIYQEEIEVDKNFTVSDGADLAELDTSDVELLDEEAGPSNKRLQKSKRLLERQERHGWLDARVAEADSDADNFWYVIHLLLL